MKRLLVLLCCFPIIFFTACEGWLLGDEIVENGIVEEVDAKGNLVKERTYKDGEEVERKVYYKRDGEYAKDSYAHYIFNEGIVTEEIRFNEGDKVSHKFYEIVDGQQKELYTDYFENGEFVKRKEPFKPKQLQEKK